MPLRPAGLASSEIDLRGCMWLVGGSAALPTQCPWGTAAGWACYFPPGCLPPHSTSPCAVLWSALVLVFYSIPLTNALSLCHLTSHATRSLRLRVRNQALRVGRESENNYLRGLTPKAVAPLSSHTLSTHLSTLGLPTTSPTQPHNLAFLIALWRMGYGVWAITLIAI